MVEEGGGKMELTPEETQWMEQWRLKEVAPRAKDGAATGGVERGADRRGEEGIGLRRSFRRGGEERLQRQRMRMGEDLGGGEDCRGMAREGAQTGHAEMPAD